MLRSTKSEYSLLEIYGVNTQVHHTRIKFTILGVCKQTLHYICTQHIKHARILTRYSRTHAHTHTHTHIHTHTHTHTHTYIHTLTCVFLRIVSIMRWCLEIDVIKTNGSISITERNKQHDMHDKFNIYEINTYLHVNYNETTLVHDMFYIYTSTHDMYECSLIIQIWTGVEGNIEK